MQSFTGLKLDVFRRFNIPSMDQDLVYDEAFRRSTLYFNPSKKLSFYDYLAFILKNECKRYLKKRKVTTEQLRDIPSEEGRDSQIMRDCVDSLPDEMRQIIIQKHYQGYTLTEIGELNGYSAMTACKKVKDAESELRNLYVDYLN